MNLQDINWLDVLLGGTVLVSAVVGLTRGLVKEILSLLAWLLALWLAYLFAEPFAAQIVRRLIPDKLISYVASFGGIFLVALFAIGLVNIVLSSLLESIGLTSFDRMLGMLFGLARGAILSALLVFFAAFIPALTEEPFWHRSRLAPSFMNLANWGLTRLPATIRERIGTRNHPGGQAESEAVERRADKQRPDSVDIELESLQNGGTPAGQAQRPAIDVRQQARQIAHSNALSDVDGDHGIALESLQNGVAAGQAQPATVDGRQERRPVARGDTRSDDDGTISLESLPSGGDALDPPSGGKRASGGR